MNVFFILETKYSWKNKISEPPQEILFQNGALEAVFLFIKFIGMALDSKIS